MKIETVELPVNSLQHGLWQQVTYQDAYQVNLINSELSIDDIYMAIFAHSPAWVNKLMTLRNKLVKPLGLKTGALVIEAESSGHIQVGDQLGIFRVIHRNDNEIVVGEDDSHLDFRISVLKNQAQNLVTVSTQVKAHNSVGRYYMAVIKPFHKQLVKFTLNDATKKGRI